MPEEEKEKREPAEQRAHDLLEGLRSAADRVRRVQVLVALLGSASFVFALYLDKTRFGFHSHCMATNSE